MRIRALPWLMVAALSIAGCAEDRALAPDGTPGAGAPEAPGPAQPEPADKDAPSAREPAPSRKVMRRAALVLEVPSPGKVETEVTTLVERAGGYVAGASHQRRSDEGARSVEQVTLTLRVPSDKLGSVLARIKRLGAGSAVESLSSEDVTEEYIDLEAGLKNQRAMEGELLELLKRASSVEDALKVQTELVRVRTEIDRMEGRRRFIDHETELATLVVTLTELRPLIAATSIGFWVGLREAFTDSVDIGAAVIIGAIRLLGVLVPLLLLLGLPLTLALHWHRRSRRALSAGGRA